MGAQCLTTTIWCGDWDDRIKDCCRARNVSGQTFLKVVEENTVKIEVEMGLTIEHEEIYSENGS